MNVQHNMPAIGSARALGINEKNKIKCFEKLSTGYRINRAADDAAGLSISEKMRAQIRGLDRAVQNIEDGIGYVQTADAALSEIHDILHRVHELAVQSANDTNTEIDRECIDTEVQLLKEEMDRIFEETEFNTIKIWDTKMNNRVQIGTKEKQAVTMKYYSNRININEKNKGAIAIDNYAHTDVDGFSTYFGYSSADCGYKIQVQGTDPADASTYGFKVTWTGWNTKKYSTELVPWTDVGTGAFAMKISDYFPVPTPEELTGIDFQLGWTTADSEVVTINDVAASIDGLTFSSSISASESVDNNQKATDISTSVSINYLAELASDRNTETYDTTWIEALPTGATNVITQPSYTDPRENTGWEIHFTMPNIGAVTAKSTYISYSGNDRTDKAYPVFWHWEDRWDGSKWIKDYYRVGNKLYPDVKPAGSLHALTDCASNDKILLRIHWAVVLLLWHLISLRILEVSIMKEDRIQVLVRLEWLLVCHKMLVTVWMQRNILWIRFRQH